MPHSSNDRSVSALRRRMLEDMAMRGLREATQRDYIRVVQSFAAVSALRRTNAAHRHPAGFRPVPGTAFACKPTGRSSP